MDSPILFALPWGDKQPVLKVRMENDNADASYLFQEWEDNAAYADHSVTLREPLTMAKAKPISLGIRDPSTRDGIERFTNDRVRS